MISNIERKLVIEEFCHNSGITNPVIKDSIELEYLGPNGIDANSFSVTRLFNPEDISKTRSLYVLEKTCVIYLGNQKASGISKTYGQMNKSQVISWVKQQLNIHLLESDISSIITEQHAFTVVMSSDSMRFKNSFKLYRI